MINVDRRLSMVASMYEYRQRKSQVIESNSNFCAPKNNEQSAKVVDIKENNKKKRRARDVLLSSAQKLGW